VLYVATHDLVLVCSGRLDLDFPSSGAPKDQWNDKFNLTVMEDKSLNVCHGFPDNDNGACHTLPSGMSSFSFTVLFYSGHSCASDLVHSCG
jgi:hypothetical protein